MPSSQGHASSPSRSERREASGEGYDSPTIPEMSKDSSRPSIMAYNKPQPRIPEQSSHVESSTTAPEDQGEEADYSDSDSSDSLAAAPVSAVGSRSGHAPSSPPTTERSPPPSDRVVKPHPRISQPRNRSGSSSGGSDKPRPRVDVANWAPVGQTPVLKTTLPQLPDYVTAGTAAPTSLNISQVQREMEFSIGALVSEKVFEELMSDSLGRHRFREFLQRSGGDVASFDLWVDLRAFKNMTDKVKITSVALHEVFSQTSKTSHPLSTELKEDVLLSLRQGMIVGDSLDLPQQHLLQSLYTCEFQAFLKHKLIEDASVRLGQVGLTADQKKGLGDAFCLTNPRLKDHPIVLVSRGFENLTGYAAKFIVGRNCRFLAGPATNPATSKRIRDSLNRGEGINTLVLNYRRNGEPFWNLLCIIPLRGVTGELTYFIGGQTEVTGTLAAGHSLSYLVGSDRDPTAPLVPSDDFSPSLRAYTAALTSSMGAQPHAGMGPGMGLGPMAMGPGPGFSTMGTERVNLAGGQARVGRQNEYHGPTEKKGIKGFFNALAGKKKTTAHGRDAEEQQIGGAEAMFDKQAKPVELQIAHFSSVYRKVVIFRRKSREILFVTPEFLAFAGLPHSSPSDIHPPSLIHTDLLSAIVAPQHADFRATRKTIKDAIRGGRSLSLEVGVKVQTRKRMIYEVGFKYGVLHLTPLIDRDGTVEAYVGILGG